MTESASDEAFLREVISLANSNVEEGGGPFGALIVKDGEVVAVGENRVTRDNDPSAHAEVTAIRRAATALRSYSLAGCTLYTSCEPCPMCASTALWARVDAIVFAADRDDAALGGFDDSRFWNLMRADYSEWDIPVRRAKIFGSSEPFVAWASALNRIDY